MVGCRLEPICMHSEMVTPFLVFDHLQGFYPCVLDIAEKGLHPSGETLAYNVLFGEKSRLRTANRLVEREVGAGSYEGRFESIVSAVTLLRAEEWSRRADTYAKSRRYSISSSLRKLLMYMTSGSIDKSSIV